MPRSYHNTSSKRITSAFVGLTELHQLQHFAQLQEQRKFRSDSFRKEDLEPQPVERVGNYADPLSPLRQGDLDALAQLFYRSDMATIEADVNQMLLRLLPEPCWEDEGLDFLSEFL